MEGERLQEVAVAEVMPIDMSMEERAIQDAAELSHVLKKTDEQLRLEKDIADLIGKEMPIAGNAPREAPDIEHMRMNEFIAETNKNLAQQLDQAYNEQAWWNDRVRSLERVRDAVNVLDNNLNAVRDTDSVATNTYGSGKGRIG